MVWIGWVVLTISGQGCGGSGVAAHRLQLGFPACNRTVTLLS